MVIKEDLFSYKPDSDVPILCDWMLHENSPDTYYNTPAIFPMYITGLMCAYMNQMGGLEHYKLTAAQRSQMLWSTIDNSGGFYASKITDKAYRSRINVIFRINGGQKQLEEAFIKEAGDAHIV